MKERDTAENRDEDSGADEPFLRRWRRRKGEAAGPPPGQGQPDEPVAAEAPDAADEPSDEAPPHEACEREPEAKGDEDMPPLESIDQGGGVAEFFSPGVSEGLRRAALRRLFSQSALPVGDDLDDYAGDYTKYTKLGDLVTNEMRHRLEVVRQKLEKRAKEELAAAETGADTEHAADARQADVSLADQDSATGTAPDSEESDQQEHTENDRNTG